MLTEVKNQIKVTFLSIKYAIMREMLNKVTFISNVIFMILNNASFIVQWLVLYSIKNEFGGYSFNQVMLLWGLAASTYGFSHFFCKNAYKISDYVVSGKLDAFLVQPKNVLIQTITSDISVSALGDILYGFIMVFITGFSVSKLVLFTIFSILGAISLTSFAVLLGSISFWVTKADTIASTGFRLATNFATYPGGIFKGFVKGLLYIALPVGIVNYLPVDVMYNFDIRIVVICLVYCIIITVLACAIFNKGLKNYTSSNLMSARM